MAALGPRRAPPPVQPIRHALPEWSQTKRRRAAAQNWNCIRFGRKRFSGQIAMEEEERERETGRRKKAFRRLAGSVDAAASTRCEAVKSMRTSRRRRAKASRSNRVTSERNAQLANSFRVEPVHEARLCRRRWQWRHMRLVAPPPQRCARAAFGANQNPIRLARARGAQTRLRA